MICAELEKLEAEFNDIVTALEEPNLLPSKRLELESAYAEISQRIRRHEASGHNGTPCYEE